MWKTSVPAVSIFVLLKVTFTAFLGSISLPLNQKETSIAWTAATSYSVTASILSRMAWEVTSASFISTPLGSAPSGAATETVVPPMPLERFLASYLTSSSLSLASFSSSSSASSSLALSSESSPLSAAGSSPSSPDGSSAAGSGLSAAGSGSSAAGSGSSAAGSGLSAAGSGSSAAGSGSSAAGSGSSAAAAGSSAAGSGSSAFAFSAFSAFMSLSSAALSLVTTSSFSSSLAPAKAVLIDVVFHAMSASDSVSKIAMNLPSGVLAPCMMRSSVFSNIGLPLSYV